MYDAINYIFMRLSDDESALKSIKAFTLRQSAFNKKIILLSIGGIIYATVAESRIIKYRKELEKLSRDIENIKVEREDTK